MFDLLILGPTVFDGSGGPSIVADVGVSDGKVAAIGRLAGEEASLTMPGTGLALAPGFLDFHSHSDTMLLVRPAALEKVSQGVTAELIGHCGVAAAPLAVGTESAVRDYYAGVLGTEPPVWDWHSFEEYLQKLEAARPALNVCTLAAHGCIRITAVGFAERRATQTELTNMAGLVRECMEAGAFGLSTDLRDAPGHMADVVELAELCRPVAAAGGFFVAHIRNQSDLFLEAIEEILEVGRRTGVRLHLTHLKVAGPGNWPKMNQALEMIERARSDGIAVTADLYPYIAGSSMLSVLLPPWVAEGGVDAMALRLTDSRVRARVRQDFEQGLPGWENRFHSGVGWSSVYLVTVASPERQWQQGLSIEEIAKRRGTGPLDAVMDILVEERGHASHLRFQGCEENVEIVLRAPGVMVGSDSVFGGVPHPRLCGTFPRILGRYVRERRTLSLSEAIHKMTSLPAQTLGLQNRGRVAEGNWADLVLFDPDRVADGATFSDPLRRPVGIQSVVINGEVVYEQNTHLGARPGVVLRHRAGPACGKR
ncbi:MAG: D-aminoacylase [Bacillota bacterium]|nr:D-aminoacylase [Bacillota bacterium]